ncbi:unannotated protein [freshwater metagenome]|uniref:Unannotated protein n=1 Tax=freshwater metagenome TaxID=449393 RepID=A0A6J7EEN3_9ZZZZ
MYLRDVDAGRDDLVERAESGDGPTRDDDLCIVRDLLDGLLNRLDERRLGDDEARLAESDQMLELARSVRDVRRHQHRTDPRHREPGDEELRAVAQVQDDEVALHDSKACERARAALDLGAQLGVGHLAHLLLGVLVDQEGLVAPGLHLLVEQVDHRAVTNRIDHAYISCRAAFPAAELAMEVGVAVRRLMPCTSRR